MRVYRQPPLPSLCPRPEAQARRVCVAAVQMRWFPDAAVHKEQLAEGIRAGANGGADIVFLPELTLSRYPADTLPQERPDTLAEALEGGPTHVFAAELARECDVFVHASLYERTDSEDGLGFNTAIIVAPSGDIVAKTRKLHIPVTTGYYEDHYFRPGPADDAYPVHSVSFDTADLQIGLPTCWDEWFPEVARAYGLGGAELLAYPTAIGSEPDYPQFDTEPLLKATIVGHAIANGVFIVMANRFGQEGTLQFYGSSFIVDCFGRILAQAPRDESCVLLADIDLAQRQDWLTLFPFYGTRRPDTYSRLVEPLVNPRGEDGQGILGGIPGVPPRDE